MEKELGAFLIGKHCRLEIIKGAMEIKGLEDSQSGQERPLVVVLNFPLTYITDYIMAVKSGTAEADRKPFGSWALEVEKIR